MGEKKIYQNSFSLPGCRGDLIRRGQFPIQGFPRLPPTHILECSIFQPLLPAQLFRSGPGVQSHAMVHAGHRRPLCFLSLPFENIKEYGVWVLLMSSAA